MDPSIKHPVEFDNGSLLQEGKNRQKEEPEAIKKQQRMDKLETEHVKQQAAFADASS